MVAGAPPLRANKARYYEDKRCVERILPPPPPRTEFATALESNWRNSIAESETLINFSPVKQTEAQANSGIRRELDPQPHEAVDPEPAAKLPLNEFIDDEDLETAGSKRKRLRQLSQSVTRQSTMDRDNDLNR